MSVASCRSTFLCLMPCLVVCLSRPISDFGSRIDLPICGCACREVSTRGVTQPGSVRPSPARAPPAPPPPLPLSFGFPAQQPPSPSPTSLSPWCPRVWRRQSPEFGPRGELPPLISLSSLPLPLSSPLRPPFFPPCARSLRARPRRGRDPGDPVPRWRGLGGSAPRRGRAAPAPPRAAVLAPLCGVRPTD
jgi:hypothetical protein